MIPLGTLFSICSPLAEAVGKKDEGKRETTTCDDGQCLPKNNVVEELQGGDHVPFKARSFIVAMSLPRSGDERMLTTHRI